MSEAPITKSELASLFGDRLPMEAVGLLWEMPGEMTIGELRAELRKIAAKPRFDQYRRTQIAEMRPWRPSDDMARVSISAADKEAGSPRAGDMIARNPKNHDDQWLVAAAYFS